jgi:uncharacterized membrane protein YphA (DoxX/SURF4 family)
MNTLQTRWLRISISLIVAVVLFLLCPACFDRITLGLILVGLLLIVNFEKIFGFMPLTQLARIAVGGLFIFSGFIKANDPVGFSYKLEEYFEVFGQGFSCDMKLMEKVAGIPCEKEMEKVATPLNIPPVAVESSSKKFWHFFAEHSLLIAIVVCAFEIVLGIFLLVGFQVRLTLWLLLAMIVFFSFLTFYSACCNKVTSCGCFGDAIKLTPWESFWKDMILLILIALLFAGERHIKPIFSNSIIMAGIIGTGTFLSFAFPVYTWQHLPLIDFRPYKIATHLYSETKRKPGCVNDEIKYIFYMQKKGAKEIRSFSLENYPDSTWEMYCRYDSIIKKGNCSIKIADFNITNPETGENLNEQLLRDEHGQSFMVVMYSLDKANTEKIAALNAFAASCKEKGKTFYGLTGSTSEEVAAFRRETGATWPIYNVDGTVLKTVIRSNPGLVELHHGIVWDMWHYNDFPSFADTQNP